MKEVFWNTIASYNAATWTWQLAFIAAAAVLTILLWFRPRRWVRIAAKLYMVIISLWIAFVLIAISCILYIISYVVMSARKYRKK